MPLLPVSKLINNNKKPGKRLVYYPIVLSICVDGETRYSKEIDEDPKTCDALAQELEIIIKFLKSNPLA